LKYPITLCLAALAMPAFTQANDFEFNLGLGLSDVPIATFHYTDGSTKDLTAGNGLGILFGTDLYQAGPVTLQAKAGFHFTSMYESQDDLTVSHTLSYAPLMLNARYGLTDKISISGGVSYLALPRYTIRVNDDKLKTKLKSSIGFNIEAKYKFTEKSEYRKTDLSYTLRLVSNTAEYVSYSDSNNASGTLRGVIDDEIIRSIQFGFNLGF